MSETVQTVIMCVVFIVILDVLKVTLGLGASLTVAVAAMAYCVGFLSGAGASKRKLEDTQ